MKEHDKRVSYRLQNIRDNDFKRDVLNNVIDLKGNFNMLQEYLYVYMALKTWKTYSKKMIENTNNFQDSQDFTENDLVNSVSDSSDDEERKSVCL
jgi:hypothetical protein